MDWNQIGGLIQQFTGGQTPPAEQVEQHYDQVAQNVPASDLMQGLSQAFHSDQTPPFSQMVGNLFQNSNGEQRAGLLNQLLSSVGPGALGGLLGGGALSGLAGILSHGGQVTPEQAAQVSPDAVQQLAEHAQQNDPSIVDRVSGFYAQHPTLVKALGAAAMWIAISHIGNRNR